MSIDTVNLIQHVYDVFYTAYSKVTSNQAFLAFEPIGIPLSDGMFKLGTPPDYCPALAIERLSEIANKVPLVQEGTVVRGMNTVEDVASLMLTTSMPVDANAMVPLGAVKQAEAGPFSATLGSMSGVPNEQFRPVYASPPDWYVEANAANWTSHSVGEQPPPANANRTPVPFRPPIWRVLPAAQHAALATPLSASHPLLIRQSLAAVGPRPPPALGAAGVSVRPMLAMAMPASVAHITAAPMPITPKPVMPTSPNPAIRPLELTLVTTKLAASATEQAVAASSISMSFDHCIVMLNRPWFPGQLMLLQKWFLPGYGQGTVSNSKGAGDTGLMPILTTGFVAIRNVKIASKWSDSDLAAIQGAASFGPFSLVGRSYDQVTGALSSSGMQIVGWFCSALPVTPPAPDPAVATTART
jgi:hypothetical protein